MGALGNLIFNLLETMPEPERDSPTRLIIEGVTSKEDYRKRAKGNKDLAEEMAEYDEKSAIRSAKDYVLDYLAYFGRKTLPKSLSFTYMGCCDCDSHRWHGSYYHDIQVDGPAEIIAEIRTAIEIEDIYYPD